MFHTRLNNFPAFRNNRDIDFAFSCMDDLATYAQISMYWNLMFNFVSNKIGNDQELILSDPISYPQNQKGNN